MSSYTSQIPFLLDKINRVPRASGGPGVAGRMVTTDQLEYSLEALRKALWNEGVTGELLQFKIGRDTHWHYWSDDSDFPGLDSRKAAQQHDYRPSQYQAQGFAPSGTVTSGGLGSSRHAPAAAPATSGTSGVPIPPRGFGQYDATMFPDGTLCIGDDNDPSINTIVIATGSKGHAGKYDASWTDNAKVWLKSKGNPQDPGMVYPLVPWKAPQPATEEEEEDSA
ncbi:hypothetical protein PVAG01_11490 [Phlyctema vagabunda]|uniref:Uncharacterized protein n=1 Tax=Phlyctema vagabunda TaxID=108571 RepID=A0ABR4P1K8_9HELO